jgi:hypothetical protein
MSVQIFIENNVPNRNNLINTLNSSVSQITTETEPDISINRIGFLWSFDSTSKIIPFGNIPYNFTSTNTSKYFTQEFFNFINYYTNPIVVDLISYPDDFNNFNSEINQLKSLKPNITFNFSVILLPTIYNLIAESSNENITNAVSYTHLRAHETG